MKSQLLEVNSVNIAALGVGFADLDAVLTTLVLITALVFNIQKIKGK